MQGIKNKDTTLNNSTKSVLGLLSSSAHDKLEIHNLKQVTIDLIY